MKQTIVKEFSASGSLRLLNVNQTNGRNGKYFYLFINRSLKDDPANTRGDIIWCSPDIQVLPIQNCMIDIKYQIPI